MNFIVKVLFYKGKESISTTATDDLGILDFGTMPWTASLMKTFFMMMKFLTHSKLEIRKALWLD
jgi:hypothetical protein